MKCPYCEAESGVIDSRMSPDGVRRRRECPECKRRFTTYEKLGEPNLKVTKRNGRTEPFSPDKLARSLARIGRGRPGLGESDVLRLVRAIEGQLLDEQVKSVPSARIVEMALERLAGIDRLAHDRLAVDYLGEDGQLRIHPQAADDDDIQQLGLFTDDDPP